MERKKRRSRITKALYSNKGYLLISTLSLLVLSGIFSQAVIQISANQLIQLNQFSSAYQAKAALNISERIFKEYISKNDKIPKRGIIHTSIGVIKVIKEVDNHYQMELTSSDNNKYYKEIVVEIPKEEILENETLKDELPLLKDESTEKDSIEEIIDKQKVKELKDKEELNDLNRESKTEDISILNKNNYEED